MLHAAGFADQAHLSRMSKHSFGLTPAHYRALASRLVDTSYHMEQTERMRTVGVREVRKILSTLLDEVRKGREVVITERGRPVAKLVPPDRTRGKGVPNLARFRRRMPVFDPPLSTTVAEDRADRL